MIKLANTREIKNVAVNRKARHDYEIIDTYEAGIALEGNEVKSLREGKISLQDSYAKIENGEVFLCDVHISQYSHSNSMRYDPKRRRKLLLKKREIRKLSGKTHQSGVTLIPLSIYFNEKNFAKVELALARGKHLYDKRESIKKKTIRRELESAIKRN
ncbi:SsrA-binding protein SmpB [Candidatus Poribacteria bacterium]|nr:SsrA-binding protein SmpB [Candidatus Poribacteria bacterium]